MGELKHIDIAGAMILVADASKRADGSDTPLGEQCRQAADEIIRLRAALASARNEALERAALWHDYKADYIDALPFRSSANRDAQRLHREAAAAIRKLKETGE